ncbi:MAG: YncE family protein, partial [Nitrososphaerales archaeon]
SSSKGSQYLAVNPIANKIYSGDAVIDGTSNKVIGHLGFNSSGIAIDPHRNLVYAITQASVSSGNTTLKIFDGSSDSLLRNVPINGTATAIAVNSFSNMVYISICSQVSYCAPSYLIAFNGTSDTIVSRIFLGLQPYQDTPLSIALNPQTNMIYVTTHRLISINGTTNTVVAETSVSAYAIQCRGVAVNPLTNEIYVTGWGLQNFGSFFIVNGVNYSVLNAFIGTGDPVGVAYDENNTSIYVVNSLTDSVLALNSSAFVVS